MSKPIGVYDSGIGGYTVLNALKTFSSRELALFTRCSA